MSQDTPNTTFQDRHGKSVQVGDIIRVVALNQAFIAAFPLADQLLISSMIGRLFKIYGIDEFGQPWVSCDYHDEQGKPQSHVIALDPEEFEKI